MLRYTQMRSTRPPSGVKPKYTDGRKVRKAGLLRCRPKIPTCKETGTRATRKSPIKIRDMLRQILHRNWRRRRRNKRVGRARSRAPLAAPNRHHLRPNGFSGGLLRIQSRHRKYHQPYRQFRLSHKSPITGKQAVHQF